MPVPFHARPTLVAISLLFAICFATPLWAQKDAGTIVGAVRDPSGAVVPGAKVTVEDVDRGVQMTLSTNDEGEYVASPLHIGRYKIRVEKTGFKSAVSEVVELNVQGRVAINIALQVGQISEEILVTGSAPLLETETSELGQVVDQKRVSNLPLNGRNFAQLALLSTGTAPSEPGARDEGGYGFSSNGARSLQNKHAAVFVRPTSGFSHETGGVRVIQEDHGVVLLCQRDDVGQLGSIAVHRSEEHT